MLNPSGSPNKCVMLLQDPYVLIAEGHSNLASVRVYKGDWQALPVRLTIQSQKTVFTRFSSRDPLASKSKLLYPIKGIALRALTNFWELLYC